MCPEPRKNKNKKMGKCPTVELATQPCVSNRQKENDGKEKVFKNSMV